MTEPTPDLIRETLDGRPQTWLAEQVKVNPSHLNRVLRGHRPLSRSLYERCRRVLPALPPWPAEIRTAA
jgi:hypothetical protein